MFKFGIDGDQYVEFTAWMNNHNCSITDIGAIGGPHTFEFTPTSIGTVTTVRCACGSFKDLTDYLDW